MEHQVAYLAAAGGKHRDSNSNGISDALIMTRRLLMAAAVLSRVAIGDGLLRFVIGRVGSRASDGQLLLGSQQVLLGQAQGVLPLGSAGDQ